MEADPSLLARRWSSRSGGVRRLRCAQRARRSRHPASPAIAPLLFCLLSTPRVPALGAGRRVVVPAQPFSCTRAAAGPTPLPAHAAERERAFRRAWRQREFGGLGGDAARRRAPALAQQVVLSPCTPPIPVICCAARRRCDERRAAALASPISLAICHPTKRRKSKMVSTSSKSCRKHAKATAASTLQPHAGGVFHTGGVGRATCLADKVALWAGRALRRGRMADCACLAAGGWAAACLHGQQLLRLLGRLPNGVWGRY